jgi:magnesium transporter
LPRAGLWDHGPVNGYLVSADGSAVTADTETVRRLLGEGQLLWLDLLRPDESDLALLTDVLGIHPLAVEDADHFGQRPKFEDYDDFTQVVAFGVRGMGAPFVEVHCMYSERYLVTVRQDDCPAFAEMRAKLARPVSKRPSRLLLLHHLLDGLVDGFFPVLSEFDDRIDEIQDEILAKPTDSQLSELFTMKRWLIGARKIVTPQRDMMVSLLSGVSELPGMTPDAERYFRDLYDHLIRISDLVDSYRDLLTGAMDSYLSTVSNRLNDVMKQLTVIATIFLPLTFLTGFFGQNFAWMVGHLNGVAEFLFVGIGTEIAAVAGLFVLFRRRGWI